MMIITMPWIRRREVHLQYEGWGWSKIMTKVCQKSTGGWQTEFIRMGLICTILQQKEGFAHQAYFWIHIVSCYYLIGDEQL